MNTIFDMPFVLYGIQMTYTEIIYSVQAVYYVRYVVIARSFTGAVKDYATPVHTATSAASVAATNLPTSSCAFQVTKPTSAYVTRDSRAVSQAAVDSAPHQSCIGRQVVNSDGGQLTATRSLLTLSQQRPVQLSRSTDRMTPDSQLTQRPVTVHGTNVQRSHSFTTTSHQLPANCGQIWLTLNNALD